MEHEKRSVYLLTNDGHRDSVNLQYCAMNDERTITTKNKEK